MPLCACGCGERVKPRRRYVLGHFKCKGQSAERMREVSKMRDMEKLRARSRVLMSARIAEWKASGKHAEYEERRASRLRGSHGYGRTRMGNPDHNNAKVWTVRDPAGRIYTFSNLREWARQNVGLLHDYKPGSKMPFPARISHGIKNLQNPNGKACSYYGWVLVSVTEKGPDLLGRDEAGFKGVEV